MAAAATPKIRTLTDRIANRAVRHLPSPMITVAPTRPLVTFTFDDCPDTAFDPGAGLLEAAGVRGTFYISGGLLSRREPERTLIGPEAVRDLARRGHEIACHTFAHTKLGALSRAALAEDLDRNQECLDRLVGPGGKRSFATPYALTTPFAQPELRRRYLTARGGRAVVNRGRVDPHNLGGVEIGDIRPSLDALLPFVEDAVADPGWLIFFTHDIATAHTPWGTTPDLLAALIAAVQEAGCAIVTTDEALDALGVREELAGRLARAA